MANRSGTRGDRGYEGPVGEEELIAMFERGYSLATKSFIARSWDVDSEEGVEAVWSAMSDHARVAPKLKDLTPHERALLGEFIVEEGRVRAENLRKEMLLRGLGETSETMRGFIRQGVIVVIPGSGQANIELETMLERRAFLQQELALPKAVFDLLAEQGVGRQQDEIGAWSGEVDTSRSEAVQSLELNLLHLSSALERDVLRLNKSGAPNRRSLTKFIGGLTRPATSDVAEPWLDVNDVEQADYLAFLFALAKELGLTQVDEDEQTLSGDPEAVAAYFTLDADKRGRKLLQASQNLKGWSELLSPSIGSGRQSEQFLEAQLSQWRDNGAPLIGARGYVLSVLRRAHFHGWTPMDSVVELCVNLDRDYLLRVLGNLDDTPDVKAYVRAFIEHLLFWSGLVEIGESTQGERIIRLTDHGAERLDAHDGEEDDPEEGAQEGCLFIQPNMEAMVFLDAAPMRVLYRLYQLGNRVNLADRVATFKLDAESVQRGYSQGLDAEEAIELLQTNSHAPIPDNITFELKNWERVWKRLTLWAKGTLIRHQDPDKLDSILGQLRHAFRDDDDFLTERLAAGSVFVSAPDEEKMFKQLERDGGVRIDYLGYIPPALEVVEDLTFSYSPMTCDIDTVSEVKRISVEDRDASSAYTRVVTLVPKLIEEHWRDDTLHNALEFLHQRVKGGLPAEQEIQLRSELAKPPSATVRRRVFVVTLEDKAGADLFERTERAADTISTRISERSFAIPEEHFDDVWAMMEDLGVRVEEV